MDRGAWRATVHGVAKSQTLLSTHAFIVYWRKWQSTPVLLLGRSHGQRSLEGYSPWGHKESDTTEQLHSLTHSSIIPSLYFGTIDKNWTLVSDPGLKPSPVWCIFLFIYAFIHYSIFLLVHWTRSLSNQHIFNQVLCKQLAIYETQILSSKVSQMERYEK